MARIDEDLDEYRHGSLVVEPLSSDCVEVFYIPSKEKLVESVLPREFAGELDLHSRHPIEPTPHRVKLLRIDGGKQRLTIFPTNTIGGHDNFLKPKYKQIERITLSAGNVVYRSVAGHAPSASDEIFMSPSFGPTKPLEMSREDVARIKPVPSTQEEVMQVLEHLPRAFTKDYDHGLGLAKPYRFIVDAVEKLSDCNEIVISECETGIDQKGKIFYIEANDFETARKLLNSTTTISQAAARSVKDGTVYNFFAAKLKRPEIPVRSGRHPLRKQLTSVIQGEEQLSVDDQDAVLRALAKNSRSIAETKPEKLAKLQGEIELVTLEVLITRYEEMIAKTLNEGRWQKFFNENPFILSLAFGYPIIKIQQQSSVGGRKISGEGDKIADFVVKNSMTNNTAIIEIKTPQEKLLNAQPYREGVYTPSTELSGSINQALDQKYRFEREIAQIKENSRIHDIESYSVHCRLIIGTMPTTEDRHKSFEQFRRNSKAVEIVTFDELLKKLKELRVFLASAETESATQNPLNKPPF